MPTPGLADGNEIVVRISDADFARLRREPLLLGAATGRAVSRRTVRRFYDTPDFHFLSRDRFLAVSRKLTAVRIDGRPDAVSAVALRSALDANGLAMFNGTAFDAIFVPVFEIELSRTVRELALSDGTRIESVFESGMVRAGSAQQPVRHWRIKLLDGSIATVRTLLVSLAASYSFRIDVRDDRDIGRDLVLGRHCDVLRATELDLKPEMTIEVAIEAILKNCLDHLVGNLAPVLDAQLPEGIHQMRVALRRLRAALGLFKQMLPGAALEHFRDELRWVAGALGRARDWDVFLETILPPVIQALHEATGLNELRSIAESERTAFYVEVNATLRGNRFFALLLELQGWIAGRGWRDQPVTAESALLFQPIGIAAPAWLERRRRKVARRGRALAELPPDQRHDIRKDIKKLRYAGEFLADVVDARRVRRLTMSLGKLQEELGLLNDIATAQRLIEQLPDLPGPETARRTLAAGMVVGWHAATAARRAKRLDDLWSRFTEIKSTRPPSGSAKDEPPPE